MPQPKPATAFVFDNYHTGDARVDFRFQTEFKDGSSESYQESIEFPKLQATNLKSPGLTPFLKSLHLMLGVSYWKMYCAPRIKIAQYKLTSQEANFWNTVYTKGLGEFFYVNRIKWQSLVNFPTANPAVPSPAAIKTENKSLLGFSGGKDSHVAFDLLQAGGYDFTPFIMSTNDNKNKIVTILKTIGHSQPLIIKRHLDPKLNSAANIYKGHIPFSAVLAFVAITYAALADYRYVIVGNEKGASEGNLDYLGLEVNHQWSKSYEFEKLFSDYARRYLTPDIKYFSLLRPLSELKIMELFSRNQKALASFVSCNKVNRSTERWCKNCAKCTSTFALLSAFIPKAKLVEIVGEDLFAKPSLVETFKNLLGVSGHKPFDCVGTTEEIKLAMWKAYQSEAYSEAAAMKLFEQAVLPKLKAPQDRFQELLQPDRGLKLLPQFNKLVAA